MLFLLIYLISLLECIAMYVGRRVTILRINLLLLSSGQTCSAGLNSEEAGFSETSVFIRWRHIPEDCSFEINCNDLDIIF